MRAIDYGICRCHTCGKLSQRPERGAFICARCQTPVHFRHPLSISRTWAFTLAALILLIPANLYPIMTVGQLDDATAHTILAGVIELAKNDMLPIAIVVFIASIAVPIFKLVGIIGLLITIKRGKSINRQQAIFMYRFIVFIGRWSMLDLFVIAIMVSLVNFGKLANVEANIGASAFAAVVILTLLAARSLDPRLLWDLQQTSTAKHHRNHEPLS